MIEFKVTPPVAFRTGELAARYRTALALTVNRSVEEGQVRAQQELHLGGRIKIRSGRSAQFLERLIKFERYDRATPATLNARMGIQSTGTGTTRKSADLLIKMVVGGTFTRPATSPFFIPTIGPFAARPSEMAAIPRGLFPSALRLVDTRFTIPDPKAQIRIGSRGGVLILGKRRTFAIDQRFHHPLNRATFGIYQRRGRGGESETGVLWFYGTRIRIPQRYRFYEVVVPFIEERLLVNLPGFVNDQMRRVR